MAANMTNYKVDKEKVYRHRTYALSQIEAFSEDFWRRSQTTTTKPQENNEEVARAFTSQAWPD